MTKLNRRMPYTATFPKALGTGIVIQSEMPIDVKLTAKINAFIEYYDAVLSRFRSDSTVTAMSRAAHGGSFDFPQWTTPLFELYDRLVSFSDSAIDPCIGEDLIRLGYGADMRFIAQPDAKQHLGSLHGRPTWRGDVERHATTLVTHKAVSLDFGACGKGYLVDLLTSLIDDYYDGYYDDFEATHAAESANTANKAQLHNPNYYDTPPSENPTSQSHRLYQTPPRLVIDAGGDLYIRSDEPIAIALENPWNTDEAVGSARIVNGSFCASAPSRRNWGTMHQIHHLLNAIDGLPVNDVAATWVSTNFETARDDSANISRNQYPTATADGIATALFVCDPAKLASAFDFNCAVLYADGRAAMSTGFLGEFFTEHR